MQFYKVHIDKIAAYFWLLQLIRGEPSHLIGVNGFLWDLGHINVPYFSTLFKASY